MLLRRPQVSGALLLRDEALMRLAARCHEAGARVILSCTIEDIETRSISATTLSRAGLRGVQIKGDPSPRIFEAASRVLPTDFVIGRSCHGPAPTAADAPWSYTTVAPIFDLGTTAHTKPSTGLGIDTLERWCAAVPRVFALGGLDGPKIAPCLAVGASGVAGIRLFFGDRGHVVENMGALDRAIERHKPLAHL